MAIAINTQILGQQATSVATYCYLYEPLKIVVTESNLTAPKIFVDLIPYDSITGVAETTLVAYGEFDLNPGVNLTFDLMKLAQQHHNAGVYKFSDLNEIDTSNLGAVISKYKYYFDIYSEASSKVQVRKLPILGGRMLEQFTPTVLQSQPLNEFEYYGLDVAELENRWTTKVLQISLSSPTATNASPSIVVHNPIGGNAPCGGYLIWKSRFGGWMFWGFDLKNRSSSKKYDGNLEVGMFESTQAIGGQPFIPVDYSGISSSYSISLKSLGLSSLELLAVSGIEDSPAVYYLSPGETRMELMRMTSSTAPLDSQANGGDFSVTLKSISNTSQRTI